MLEHVHPPEIVDREVLDPAEEVRAAPFDPSDPVGLAQPRLAGAPHPRGGVDHAPAAARELLDRASPPAALLRFSRAACGEQESQDRWIDCSGSHHRQPRGQLHEG